MAAPTWRSGVPIQGTGTSPTFTPPSGVANNDILILFFYYEGADTTVTPPTDFVEITSCHTETTNAAIHVFWKRALNESGNYVMTLGASRFYAATLECYSGAVTTGIPIEVSDKYSAASSNSCVLPSITTQTIDTLIIGFASCYNFGNWSSTDFTNERADANGQAIYDVTQASAGASGSKTATSTTTDEINGAILNLASLTSDTPTGSSSISPSSSSSVSISPSLSPSLSLSPSASISPSASASPSSSEFYFEDDFSLGNFSKWDSVDTYGSGTATIVSGYARFYCPNGNNGGSPPPEDEAVARLNLTGLYAWPTGGVVWAKCRMRWVGANTATTIGGGFFMEFTNGTDLGGAFVNKWNVEFYAQQQEPGDTPDPYNGELPAKVCGTANSGTPRLHSTNHDWLDPDTWYEIWIKVDYSGTNPQATWYNNGVERDTLVDTSVLSVNATKPTYFRIGQPWYDEATKVEVHIDDVVLQETPFTFESSSISPSSSASSSVSASPSSGVPIIGTTCWGHITGVTEDNVRTFLDNWTGTGEISGVGDAEVICMEETEYMISEVVETGVKTVELTQNQYIGGDTIKILYRSGATEVDCEAASWIDYTVPFISLGYVQVRIESTL